MTRPTGWLLCLCVVGVVTAQTQTCITDPIAAVSDWNGFVFGDFDASRGARVGGLLAVGGDAHLTDFSVGDQEPPPNENPPLFGRSTRNDLVVAGEVNFTTGAVMAGGNLVWWTSQSPPTSTVSVVGRGAKFKGRVMDFEPKRAPLVDMQTTLRDLGVNGAVSMTSWGQMDLRTLSPTADTTVFRMSTSQLKATTSMFLREYGIGGGNNAIVINVYEDEEAVEGSTAEISDFAMLGDFEFAASRTIWNFHDSANIRLVNIDLLGTVLAPNADVDFPLGNVKGHFIAQSYKGHGVLLRAPFTGCVHSTVQIGTSSATRTPTLSTTASTTPSPSKSVGASVSPTISVTPSVTASVSWTPSVTPSISPTASSGTGGGGGGDGGGDGGGADGGGGDGGTPGGDTSFRAGPTAFSVMSTCHEQDHPWKDDLTHDNLGYGTAVWSCGTVGALLGGMAVYQVRWVGGVKARVSAAVKTASSTLKYSSGGVLLAVWLVLDLCFRCAGFASKYLDWSSVGLSGLRSFFAVFLLTPSHAWLLVFLMAVIAAVAAAWITTGRAPTQSNPEDANPVTKPSTSILPTAVSTTPGGGEAHRFSSPAVRAAVAVGRSVASFAITPAMYVLLMPWLCPHTVSGHSKYWVTAECDSPLKCWGFWHYVSLVASTAVMLVLYASIATTKFQFEAFSMPHFGMPHFVLLTASLRMIAAWSGRILVHFDACAASFLSLFVNIALTVAGALFMAGGAVLLPVWVTLVWVMAEIITLVFGLVAVVLAATMAKAACMVLCVVSFLIGLVLLAACAAWVVLQRRNPAQAGKPSSKASSRPPTATGTGARAIRTFGSDGSDAVTAGRQSAVTDASTVRLQSPMPLIQSVIQEVTEEDMRGSSSDDDYDNESMMNLGPAVANGGWSSQRDRSRHELNMAAIDSVESKAGPGGVGGGLVEITQMKDQQVVTEYDAVSSAFATMMMQGGSDDDDDDDDSDSDEEEEEEQVDLTAEVVQARHTHAVAKARHAPSPRSVFGSGGGLGIGGLGGLPMLAPAPQRAVASHQNQNQQRHHHHHEHHTIDRTRIVTQHIALMGGSLSSRTVTHVHEESDVDV